jgi:hypothetical protein
MGNARARGTYAERKASPQGRPPEPALLDDGNVTVLAYIERQHERVRLANGREIVRQKERRAKPGLYRDRSGRTGYRYDGTTIRRLTLDELAAIAAE